MDFWHLQMHLPEGRANLEGIDSSLMLKEPKPVIGTGEWDNIQCRYFKGEQGGLKEGSIVMVRRGNLPLALVKVTSDYFNDEALEEKYINHWYRYVEVLDWNTEGKTSSLFSQGTLNLLYEERNTASWQYINEWYQNVIAMTDQKTCIDLLKFKKQIILQGPPGTGKTKLAKEIASALTGISIQKKSEIDDSDIVNTLEKVSRISSIAGQVEYGLIGVDKERGIVTLRKSTEKEADTTFFKIKEFYKGKLWRSEFAGNDDRRAAAIAHLIYESQNEFLEIDTSDQFKIIQFHPSYSYEDFVRGIVAKPNPSGEGIIYESENKVLADFAELALDNWQNHNKESILLSKEKWVIENFQLFVDDLDDQLDIHGFINLTENVQILGIDEDAFRYKGKGSWSVKGNRMLFKDVQKAYIDNNLNRQDIKNNKKLSGLANQHASYFIRVLNLFRKFLKDKNYSYESSDIVKVELQNYVMVIDEINRSNLSSVLGELIYALEYRGQPVDGMYSVNENKALILPPNLYIIGTMNTADRSVGHIDYAIRRRFAFVDVMPKDLSSEIGDKFHKTLFNTIDSLFTTNLSAEFEKKDVQLGHSYFIDKSENGGSMNIRLEYEIKPILLEYVKDGILIGDNIARTIKELTA